jgi:hypothetical protein
MRVSVVRPGVHHLRIVCTAYHPLAALRVVHKGRTIVETGVALHEAKPEGFVVNCTVDLREREEEIELHHWPWEMTESGRQFSVLLFDIAILDSHGVKVVHGGGDAVVKEMAGTGGGVC